MKKTFYHSLDLQTTYSCDTITHHDSIEQNFTYAIQGSCSSIAGASFGKNQVVIKENIKAFSLNENTGILKVSSSTQLIDIYNYLTPKGFYLKAVPSHPIATVGGCIGYNAHGQNHDQDGCFGRHIISIKLFHPNYGNLQLSKTSSPEIFELTIGGFGLTGLILEAEIQAYRLTSNSVDVNRIPFYSFEESYDLFMFHRGKYDFFHALYNIRSQATTSPIGFLELSKIKTEHIAGEFALKSCDKYHHLPVKINIFGTSLMPHITDFYFKNKLKQKNLSMDLFDFMHPSAHKMYYFSLFGNSGIIEHQVLIPHGNVKSYFQEFRKLIKKHSPLFTLCHSKLFSGQSKFLNFDGSGFCIAIHVPKTNHHLLFLSELDQVVIRNNGISNLIKDSRLSKDILHQQYKSNFSNFKDNLLRFDPQRLFRNNISQRFLDYE